MLTELSVIKNPPCSSMSVCQLLDNEPLSCQLSSFIVASPGCPVCQTKNVTHVRRSEISLILEPMTKGWAGGETDSSFNLCARKLLSFKNYLNSTKLSSRALSATFSWNRGRVGEISVADVLQWQTPRRAMGWTTGLIGC